MWSTSMTKKEDGVFIYNNKEDVDSLNNAVAESKKQSKEMRKRTSLLGKLKYAIMVKKGIHYFIYQKNS